MLRNALVALVLVVGLGWSANARAESPTLPGVHLVEALASIPAALQLVPRLAAATPESGGLLPCTLSCLLPGLGQLFSGQILKGLLLVGAAIVTVSITAAAGISLPGFLMLGLTIAVWVVATIDAYSGGTLLPGGPEPEKKKQVIRHEDVTPPTHAAVDRRS